MENSYVYKNATIIIVKSTNDDTRIKKATEVFLKRVIKIREAGADLDGEYNQSKTFNKK